MTPILVDDIISTGRTIGNVVEVLNTNKMKPSVCVGVHAVFSNDAYSYLSSSGISQIITCNTIMHPTNQIDIGELIRHCIDENKLIG